MGYSERNLLKLLDYSNLNLKSMIEKISTVLNIQYFEDNGVYTLGSKYFVLDINKQIKITYVDDSYNDKFIYVEYYLSHFFVTKQFIEFYNHLKYFINFLDFSEKNQSMKSINNLRKSSEICKCVDNYKYCDIYHIPIFKDNFLFNIFTHRYEYHSFEDIFISVPYDLLQNNVFDPLIEYNLSDCYMPKFFNIKILKYFCNSFYKKNIKGQEILIEKNERIIVNGVYDKIKSFLFKKGNILENII